MKMKIRWLAIFLVMGLVVAACGDSGSGDTTTTAGDTTATTEAAPTETTEAETTETTEAEAMILTDIGVDLEAGTITVGLLSDLTGVFSALVQGPCR